MKKLVVVLWMSLYPLLTLAQISTVQNSTDLQFKPLTTHEILYSARTGLINKDLIPSHIQDEDPMYLFNPDTTWDYSEFKWQGFEDYEPGTFTQQFDVGNDLEFVNHMKSYDWEGDSSRWVLSRQNMSWIKDAFMDSTKMYNVDENGDPTYGSFYTYSRTPEMGATSESIYHRYDPMMGWLKDTKFFDYSNEDESISWNKTYRYNADSADFLIDRESMTEDLETHSLYEYKSFAGGQVSYWTKDFTLFNEDGTAAYSVDYFYNSTFTSLDPTDSTAFLYHENYAEAFGYKWYRNFDEWELDNYTSTYESSSSISPTGTKVDSVVTREVIYDTELDSMVTGMILSKTVYDYDVNDNVIEIVTYNYGSNGLAPFSRSTYEYELIDGVYHETLSRYYNYSHATMDLYLSTENHRFMEPDESSFGDMSYIFSDLGDTTGGYKSMMFLEDEFFYAFNYNWDSFLGEFVLSGFMVEAFAEPVSFFGYVSSEWGSDRVMVVLNSLPAAMNPGPLFLAIDDTVDIIIPAFNPDMTIPDVSMIGIPATATFDAETRRFYWVVDEVVEGPFQITATRGMKSTTIDVKVVYGEFTVGLETDKDIPNEITLFQNYPNPFNPTTTIGFELSQSENVTLTVFNILGQPVQTLVNNEIMTSGLKEMPFNANRLSSGVYYYRLEVGDKVLTKKMTLVK